MARQLFQYHPVVGYTFIPGIKARVEDTSGSYLIRTNQTGFRSDHEFASARDGQRFRALVFGNSFTAANGVRNEDRFTDLLPDLVPGLETYNFGLPGSGTDQQYLIFKDLAAGIEHDLVVVAVNVENIRRVAARYRPYFREGRPVLLAKPYFTLGQDGALTVHHQPVPREPIDELSLPGAERALIDRGGRFARLRAAVNRLGPGVKQVALRLSRYDPLPEYKSPDRPEWRLLEAILTTWAAEATVPVVVVPIPLYHYVEELASPRHYLARFAELSRAPGVTVVDPLPAYLGVPAAERKELRFGADPHPTAASHALLAAALAPHLEAQLAGRRP